MNRYRERHTGATLQQQRRHMQVLKRTKGESPLYNRTEGHHSASLEGYSENGHQGNSRDTYRAEVAGITTEEMKKRNSAFYISTLGQVIT